MNTFIELTSPGKISLKTDSAHTYAKTICSAISTGTEIAAYKGLDTLREEVSYPRLLGYCNVARVVSTGEVILTGQSHRDGFGETKIICRVPDSADFRKASTTFLYHLGYEALQRGRFESGQRVAVIGRGLLATITAEVAEWVGNSKYGDVDLVVTTSNTWENWKLALSIVKNEGTISVLGFPGRGQPLPDFNPLEPKYLYAKKLTIVYCGRTLPRTVSWNCEMLLGLIMDGKLHPEKIISPTKYHWTHLEDFYTNRTGLTAVLDYDD